MPPWAHQALARKERLVAILKALHSTGASVMPESLLDALNSRDVADLLEYVKSVK